MASSTCGDCVALVAQQTWLTPATGEKILLVVLGAILGFFSSYLLDRQKAKREPRKQLSWDASVERALIEVGRRIQAKVRFSYDGIAVKSLTHVRCTIANTGNRVVKDHDLRFPFPKGAELLEHYLDPKPEPELGVEAVDGPQCRYRVGHLEKGQEVTFNFVVAGGQFADWEPRSFNKEGDVEFQRRDVVKEKEDQEHVQPALILVLLNIALPPALALLDFGFFSDLGLFTVRMVLLGALLPHVRPIARLLNGVIANRHAAPRGGGTQNGVDGTIQGSVLQVGTVYGGVAFDLLKRGPENGAEEGDGSGSEGGV